MGLNNVIPVLTDTSTEQAASLGELFLDGDKKYMYVQNNTGGAVTVGQVYAIGSDHKLTAGGANSWHAGVVLATIVADQEYCIVQVHGYNAATNTTTAGALAAGSIVRFDEANLEMDETIVALAVGESYGRVADAIGGASASAPQGIYLVLDA